MMSLGFLLGGGLPLGIALFIILILIKMAIISSHSKNTTRNQVNDYYQETEEDKDTRFIKEILEEQKNDN